MLSSASTSSGRVASAAAARATSSHMSSGSGAPCSPPSPACHVRAATPMMHGVRGSVMFGRRASSPRLPHGRALLRERLRALLRVLRLEDRAGELRLLLERRPQVLAQLLEDRG